jgi:histidinol-phosphate aminotransferase
MSNTPKTGVKPTPKRGILDIQAYIGGKSRIEGVADPVKMSSNENPLGCSPLAEAAFLASAPRLNRYPDGKAAPLRAAIARRFALEPERLIFGAGSDEIYILLAQIYLEPGDNIVQAKHAFLSYAISARACQAEVKEAEQDNLRIDVDAMLAQVDARTKLVFIGNPDNPTGSWLSGEEVRRLHAGLPSDVVLVVDEAYGDFARAEDFEPMLDFARDKDNVVVTRTFSKLYGLAALRIGWAYAPVEMIEAMERIRLPFNTTIPAQEAATAALEDEAFVERTISENARWRSWLIEQIEELGLEVFPSQTNFILIRFPTEPGRTAAEAEAFLASKGYIVRGLGNYRLPDCIRVTVGLEPHNYDLVGLLAEFLGEMMDGTDG